MARRTAWRGQRKAGLGGRALAIALLSLMVVAGSAQSNIQLSVDPASATLAVGDARAFHAYGTFPDGQRELSQALVGSASESHSCAALSSGEVYCWGGNGSGQLGNGSSAGSPDPVRVAGLPSASSVATGRFHSCALLSDQTVMCWGANGSGQLGNGGGADSGSPVAVTGVAGATALLSGPAHSCALLLTGSVKCWGTDSNGELGDGMGPEGYVGYSPVPVTVSGISDATALAAGGLHACALRANGKVNCWGGNFRGAIGDGTLNRAWVPVEVGGIDNAVAVSAGLFHSCALRADGGAACWGDNQFGTLGDGSTVSSTTAVPVVGLSMAVSLASGWGAQHNCAVRANGALQCWGDNASGQLGDGTQIQRLTPATVAGITDVLDAWVGRQHSCALTGDGGLSCWGGNGDGQLGDGSNIPRAVPAAVSDLTVAWRTADPSVATVGLGGGVVATGAGGTQILATTSSASASAMLAVQSELSVSLAGSGSGHVSSSDGRIDCGASCAATYTSADSVTLTAVASGGFEFGGWSGACSGSGTCTINTRLNHAVVASFERRDYALTVTTSGPGRVSSSPAGIDCGLNCSVSLAAGSSLTLSPSPDPGAYFLGWTGGCLGTGGCTVALNADTSVGALFASRTLTALDLGPSSVVLPAGQRQQLTALGSFNDGSSRPIGGSVIELGDGFGCATLLDGSARCWGSYGNGELGNGTLAGASAPVPVSGLDHPIALAGGTSHACAALTNGQVRCWGRNDAAQLGDGTTNASASPVGVVGVAGTVAVVGGSQHSCALESTGGVSCWGAGGLLGNGSGQPSAAPVLVANVADALALSNEAGGQTCALLVNGEVMCWGSLAEGQALEPVLRGGLGSAVAVSAAPIHSCALLANGQVQCWGRTDFGILGDGTNSGAVTSDPVTVSGIGGAISLALGDLHSCALLGDRSVKCWGNGSLGQLGNGQTTHSNVPVTVSGLSDVTAIAAGDHHTCAVLRYGTVRCWGENNVAQLGVPPGGSTVRSTPVTALGLPPVRAIEWISSNPAVATVTAAGIVTAHLPGTATITAIIDGISDSVTLSVNGNTPVGSNVMVEPIDPGSAQAPATLNYSSVSQPGQTSLAISAIGPAAPSGFRLGDPGTYYELSTTASFSGPITVCIRYDGIDFQLAGSPRLFHYENGAWADRTTSVDLANKLVCGTVASLSPFALFESGDTTPPRMSCAVDPGTLRPPNHRLVDVQATIVVTDAESGPAGFTLLAVTSSEADAGLGSDDIAGDVVGFVPETSSSRGALRAERYSRAGRTYTLVYEARDGADNKSRCQMTVKVPHGGG